jgi:hypothetical protein
MHILSITPRNSTIKSVILFTEDSQNDYLYSHQLSIVNDNDDDVDEQRNSLYDSVPDISHVSDRHCLYVCIKNVGDIK